MAWEDQTEQPESTSGAEEEFEALPDLGQRLGLNPKSFRAILQQYSDFLPLHEQGGERGLAGSAIEYLQHIHKRTLEGYTEEEIRFELAPAEDAGGDEPDAPAVPEEGVRRAPEADELRRLLEEMRELREQLTESEQKRVRDRDKLMMSLMRTQKEMKQLRYEVSKSGTRRQRTMWDKLLGR